MAEHRTAGDTAPDDEIMPAEGEERVLELADMDYASASRVAAELDRLRSKVAALRNTGNESDDVLGALLRELAPIPWGLHEDATVARDRWRSAAGSPATAQPPAAVLRGLLAEARDWLNAHWIRRDADADDLLRRIDAATTDDAQEGQR